MANHQETLMAIANFMGDQHPEVAAHFVRKHRSYLSESIRKMHDGVVAYGPFKGLRFDSSSHWGAGDKGGMILGLYEQELLRELQVVPKKYDTFIDLGAADGYYGVGVLVNDLFKKSYCYEITDLGREVITRTAKLNGVEDRVVVRGEATANLIGEIPDGERNRSVLFVDIEGAEFNILKKEMFDGFAQSVIFVELHDWFFDDAKEKMDGLLNA